jgi:hypothetical protein
VKPVGWHNGCHPVRVRGEKEGKSIIAIIENREVKAEFSVGDRFVGLGGWEKRGHCFYLPGLLINRM